MADEAKKKDPRTVQLKNVRLSFTDTLKEKKKVTETSEPKYGCNLIIESDKPEFEANRAAVMAAIRAACEEQWNKPDALKEIAEDNPKRVCFRKGERFKNQETGDVYAGYAGNWAISASGPRGGQNRPLLLDRYKREVAENDILDVCYGGTYADAIVSFYGTDKGGKGIFCSIEAIRSRQEGERMGGGLRASASDFDDLEDDDSFGGTPAAAAAGGDDYIG